MDLFRFAKLYGLELKIEYNNFDEIVVKFTTEYGNEYIRRIQSYELDSEESKMKMQQLICDWCTEELRLNRKLLKLVNNEKVKNAAGQMVCSVLKKFAVLNLSINWFIKRLSEFFLKA